MNHDSSIVLKGYSLYDNSLWFEYIPPIFVNLFLKDKITLMEKDCDEKEGGIFFSTTPSSLCQNF